MKQQLTQSEKAKYLKMALALTGIAADERTCDMLLRCIDSLEKLGGDFSVHDAVAIQLENKRLFEDMPAVDDHKPEACGYCKCGNPEPPAHACPARPNEITTCQCCHDCQKKCAELR